MNTRPPPTHVDPFGRWHATRFIIAYYGENAWWIEAQRVEVLLGAGDMDHLWT